MVKLPISLQGYGYWIFVEIVLILTTISDASVISRGENEEGSLVYPRNHSIKGSNETYYGYFGDKGYENNVTVILGEEAELARSSEFAKVLRNASAATIHGLRVEEGSKPVLYEGARSVIVANTDTIIRLFGDGFTPNTIIKFVTDVRPRGTNCDFLESTNVFALDKRHVTKNAAIVTINLPRLNLTEQEYFVCTKEYGTEEMGWIHQGGDKWVVMKTYQKWLPIWADIILILSLLMLSGLFSGLNLGLMAMDITELKIVEKTGTEKERQYARTVQPLRHMGNYLLCSILLGNVMFNSILTILLDDITTGLIAVITSTVGIVLFGEIIPQAVCSRYGLAVGANTIWITKLTMAITFPLSYPVSFILDKILGEEIGSVYTSERLKELLRVTKDHHGLEIEEVGIISGALDLKKKTVMDVMIKLDNVFMLPLNTVLDFETFGGIEYHGYSRIPVFEEDRSNIVGLLNVKQLTLLDANARIPLKTVIEYDQNKLFFVFENTRLDYMFRTFREGNKGHMAFVRRINDEGEGDPFYQTIGVVTLEDVLEELLQAEIMDENDIGKQEARRCLDRREPIKPFHLNKCKTKALVEIPAPLALAAVQFLSTSVEPFKRETMSVAILQRLVKSCAQYIEMPKDKRNNYLPELYLYEADKPSEYFVMILDGRVEVTVGKENLTYECGAFTTFGKDFFILELAAEESGATSPVIGEKTDAKPKRRTFTPDYTVRVVSDVRYLMMKFSAFKAAMLATVIERSNADPTNVQDKNWQEEIDKVLESGDAGDEDNTIEIGKRNASKEPPFKFNGETVDCDPD